MKKTALTFVTFLFLSFVSVYGQEDTYKIVKTNNVLNIDDYKFAMDKANFDSYRYLNTRRKLTFNTGVEIELLSVQELQGLQLSVDASKASVFDSQTETHPIYKLGNNGYILIEIQKTQKK